MASLREIGIAVAAFLVKYVVVFVVSKNLVEVEVLSDTDDLSAGVTAGVVVAVAFAGVVFSYNYIVFVVVDVVLAGSFVFSSLLQLMMLAAWLLLMLMHYVYAIIFELMIWRVLFI